jgi:hypothetical protein
MCASRYMFYFNDLQIWERQEAVQQDAEPIRVYTNLLLAKDDRPIPHGFDGSGESEPSYGELKSVVEVLQRVTVLAKRHWYVLDVHLAGPSKDNLARKAEYDDFITWLPFGPNKNPWVEEIKGNPAARMAPAPFCCIRKNDFYADNSDPSAPGQMSYEAHWQIPQELFFYRMYVNMSTQFVNRRPLHSVLKRSGLETQTLLSQFLFLEDSDHPDSCC